MIIETFIRRVRDVLTALFPVYVLIRLLLSIVTNTTLYRIFMVTLIYYLYTLLRDQSNSNSEHKKATKQKPIKDTAGIREALYNVEKIPEAEHQSSPPVSQSRIRTSSTSRQTRKKNASPARINKTMPAESMDSCWTKQVIKEGACLLKNLQTNRIHTQSLAQKV